MFDIAPKSGRSCERNAFFAFPKSARQGGTPFRHNENTVFSYILFKVPKVEPPWGFPSFVKIFKIDSGGFPFLRWTPPQGVSTLEHKLSYTYGILYE